MHRFRTAFSSAFAVCVLLFSWTALAADLDCVIELGGFKPATLKTLTESAEKTVLEAQKKTPASEFFHLHTQINVEQPGVLAPKAIQDNLRADLSFVATPAPTSPGPATVGLSDPKQSVALHVDLPWKGRRTSTTVFASLPGQIVKEGGSNGYVVGNEYETVIFHLHGGGTPSATGKNAMSIGEALAKQGVPVLGIDLPGHGQATRALDGLTTMEGQVDWILALIDKLVAPGVKVVLTGHSWGGEFAVYMHKHSNEPKYARIARFVAMSPPIDVSLGGDASVRVKFEEEFEKRLPEFEHKIAATDYGFLMNVVANGKIADIPGYYTMFTNFDYQTAPLTVEEQKDLKPMLMIVGTADGLVYVGREEQFHKFADSYTGESRAVFLGPGKTFRSQGTTLLEPTGHGIFDRYIDGTTTPQVYWMLSEEVKKAGANDLDKTKPAPAVETLEALTRQYANFLGFREYLNGRVEYVRRSTPRTAEMTARKNELMAYLKQADTVKASGAKEQENEVRAALDTLRASIGLEKAIAPERAEQELSWQPLTEKSRQDLETYLKALADAEARLQAAFKDPEYVSDLEKLANEFAPLMKELDFSKIEEYKPFFEKYRSLQKPDEKQAKTRGQLMQLQQKYLEVTRLSQERFGRQRDLLTASIAKPSYVVDSRDAYRQLNGDRSPDRREKLKDFVARAPQAQYEARLLAASKLQAKIDELPRPKGISSEPAAREEFAKLNGLFESTWAPPSETEILALTEEIQQAEARRGVLYRGDENTLSLDKQFKALKSLRDQRRRLADQLATIVKAEGAIKDGKAFAAQQLVDDELVRYTSLNKAFEKKKSSALLAFRERGHLDAAHIEWLSISLEGDLNKMLEARDSYLKALKALEVALLEAAANGEIKGANREKAREIAAELDKLNPQIAEIEPVFEARSREESLLAQAKDWLVWKYIKLMSEKGYAVPFDSEKVVLSDYLNMGRDEFLQALSEKPAVLEAFQRCVKFWSDLTVRIREDDQTKAN